MNIAQIEANLQKLTKAFKKDSFVYDLLLAYGQPKASITRLQQGGLNLSKTAGEIAWKKKLFFKATQKVDVHELIEDLKTDDNALKHDPRFIVVTDYETLLAIDRKTQDTLDIPILEIARHFDFFLPWAGMEKAQRQNENPADVRAAERMAKLYDEIKKDNPISAGSIGIETDQVHNLNVFLSRLLFCFFAEDTGIFEKDQFSSGIGSHTQPDGSDLHTYLDKLFEVMNTEPGKRKNLPAYLQAFPYVNGGLYKNKHKAPVFTRRSRQAILDSGRLDWSAINPDIFGSMIQAVITPEHRGGLGMHYTSVPNIMKVIEPLFLTELKEELESSTPNGQANTKKLTTLLHRIQNIKIFDPACGSGNFLIIAYKELRRLEMKIFKAMSSLALSNISLSNFYGIELDDFAHEVATLSLWLAEHQMNQEFFKEFGRTKAALPLKEAGNIVHGNATRVEWEKVCPKKDGAEIYVLGNPPYLGAHVQSENQKEDMKIAFHGEESYKKLDYIACWIIKGASYIQGINSKLAFVSTNSICQGEQVGILWPKVFEKDLEIPFAYQSFKWTNNAKNKAAVICIIISLGTKQIIKKKLFSRNTFKAVDNISPYLIDGDNTIIFSRNKPLCLVPVMVRGSSPVDGGHLILNDVEKGQLLSEDKSAQAYLKKLIGAEEFVNGKVRWCLWISDEKFVEATKIRFIANRIEKVREFRLKSKKEATRDSSKISHKFFEVKHQKTNSIIIPRVTSERREYLQCGFLDDNTVVLDRAQAIYDAQPFIFGILSSKMHMAWTNVVTGRLKSDINYSVSLCYNNFPFPIISDSQKKELEKHVYPILEERENHSEKTLAQLYDPDKMPPGLREAHHQNDLAVERCYRSKPFESDEERLEYLFTLYEQMIAEEKTKGTLFEVEAKVKKKRK